MSRFCRIIFLWFLFQWTIWLKLMLLMMKTMLDCGSRSSRWNWWFCSWKYLQNLCTWLLGRSISTISSLVKRRNKLSKTLFEIKEFKDRKLLLTLVSCWHKLFLSHFVGKGDRKLFSMNVVGVIHKHANTYTRTFVHVVQTKWVNTNYHRNEPKRVRSSHEVVT